VKVASSSARSKQATASPVAYTFARLTRTFGADGADAPLPERRRLPEELPILSLLAAVLADAVDLVHGRVAPSARSRRERDEALAWLEDADRGLISLRFVADALGLSITAIQAAVLNRRRA
jgi:hypothetical protein